MTQKAVKAFQAKQGIVPASGYVGSKTRAKINALSALSLNAQQIATSTGTHIATSTTPTVTTQPTEQAAQIKIEVCKVEARISTNNFLEVAKTVANEVQQKCVQDVVNILQQRSGGGGVAPGNMQFMADVVRLSCGAQKKLDFLKTKADELYNKEYLACLNK